MAKIIFDIETVGENFEQLDETTQEVLTRWIKREASSEEEYQVRLKDLKDGLGFSPFTGQIVAIGVLDYESKNGAVYFQNGGKKEEFEENGIRFRSGSEKECLENFWKVALSAKEFISFNGRSFDAPYLVIRSAVHKIKPTKDLLSNRYLSSQKFDARHVDLMDQLTFYGAVWKKPSLHLACHAFGIESSKGDGIDGDQVGQFFAKGKFLDIARYNVRDLFATAKVYERWAEFINLQN